MMKTLVSVSAVMCLLTAAEAKAQEQGPSYYLIGNSLTWDTVPSKLDGDVQWHVDCGTPLTYIVAKPEKPCVKSSELWPAALANKQYDYLSMQPHYGSTLEGDVAAISTWLDMQPKATVIIHTGWGRHESRKQEYESTDVSGKLQHSPAYYKALMAELQEKYPERTFRQTHAIDLLAMITWSTSSPAATRHSALWKA